MSSMMCHPYHMVDESPWPMFGSLGGLYLTTGMVSWFHLNSMLLFYVGMLCLVLVMIQWWRDISREGAVQGLHTAIVELGLRWGMALFIVSEVFFFVSFFWAFFHSSLAPTVEVGSLWPPFGIKVFNPFQVPLLNTIVLISSGVSVTWSHHALMSGNYSQTTQSLAITVILGMYFTFLQGLEYYEASFTFADSVYGSTFFIATGFHGLHVLVGTLFLAVCLNRHMNCEFSSSHHFGFEAAAWYWHFVDVVWLFLYLVIYWWGSI
uniref:cytochrome c oxidase subunit III n=1 Tax=Calanus simillimus TaxID=148988 RepID=UPI002027E177|nr:cytochrome c oxidase subunit III [Calanus simillimus]UPP55818.1 cytochrome c oxidase subunit III [Calanus simillimus]